MMSVMNGWSNIRMPRPGEDPGHVPYLNFNLHMAVTIQLRLFLYINKIRFQLQYIHKSCNLYRSAVSAPLCAVVLLKTMKV